MPFVSCQSHSYVFLLSNAGFILVLFLWSLLKACNRPVVPGSLASTFGVPESFTHLILKENTIIAFASPVACRNILVHWKNQKSPPPNSWLKDLMFFLYLEKIKYSIRGCSENFNKTWGPMLSYVNSISSLED